MTDCISCIKHFTKDHFVYVSKCAYECVYAWIYAFPDKTKGFVEAKLELMFPKRLPLSS